MSSHVFQTPVITTASPQEQLLDSYRRTAQLPWQDLVSATIRRLRYELDLPAGDRESAVLQRLRAWLALEAAEAGHLARGFGDAFEALSAVERNDLTELQQDAIYNGLTFYEFERLAELAPWLKDLHASTRQAVQPLVSPYVLIAAAMSGASI